MLVLATLLSSIAFSAVVEIPELPGDVRPFFRSTSLIPRTERGRRPGAFAASTLPGDPRRSARTPENPHPLYLDLFRPATPHSLRSPPL